VALLDIEAHPKPGRKQGCDSRTAGFLIAKGFPRRSEPIASLMSIDGHGSV